MPANSCTLTARPCVYFDDGAFGTPAGLNPTPQKQKKQTRMQHTARAGRTTTTRATFAPKRCRRAYVRVCVCVHTGAHASSVAGHARTSGREYPHSPSLPVFHGAAFFHRLLRACFCASCPVRLFRAFANDDVMGCSDSSPSSHYYAGRRRAYTHARRKHIGAVEVARLVRLALRPGRLVVARSHHFRRFAVAKVSAVLEHGCFVRFRLGRGRCALATSPVWKYSEWSNNKSSEVCYEQNEKQPISPNIFHVLLSTTQWQQCKNDMFDKLFCFYFAIMGIFADCKGVVAF